MDPGRRESFQNSPGDSTVHPRLRTATCGTWWRSGSERNGALGPRHCNALRGKIGGVTRMGDEMGKAGPRKPFGPEAGEEGECETLCWGCRHAERE